MQSSKWSRGGLILMLSLVAFAGCGHDQVHEGDKAARYRRVFGEQPLANVDVANAVLREYRWRPGTVTTDDWEIELIAPRSWIDGQIKEQHLRPLQDESWVVKNV